MNFNFDLLSNQDVLSLIGSQIALKFLLDIGLFVRILLALMTTTQSLSRALADSGSRCLTASRILVLRLSVGATTTDNFDGGTYRHTHPIARQDQRALAGSP